MQRITLKIMPAALAGLLVVITTIPAWGAESSGPSRIPAHTPEWTDQNQFDPGMTKAPSPARRLRDVPGAEPVGGSVAEDLQKVIVLCATEPQSTEFDRAWTRYLEDHYKPGLDVDGLIEEVLLRAETQVAFGDGRRGTRMPTSVDRDKTRRRMRGVADKVISRVR